MSTIIGYLLAIVAIVPYLICLVGAVQWFFNIPSWMDATYVTFGTLTVFGASCVALRFYMRRRYGG